MILRFVLVFALSMAVLLVLVYVAGFRWFLLGGAVWMVAVFPALISWANARSDEVE
jgi:hypothetical protein